MSSFSRKNLFQETCKAADDKVFSKLRQNLSSKMNDGVTLCCRYNISSDDVPGEFNVKGNGK